MEDAFAELMEVVADSSSDFFLAPAARLADHALVEEEDLHDALDGMPPPVLGSRTWGSVLEGIGGCELEGMACGVAEDDPVPAFVRRINGSPPSPASKDADPGSPQTVACKLEPICKATKAAKATKAEASSAGGEARAPSAPPPAPPRKRTSAEREAPSSTEEGDDEGQPGEHKKRADRAQRNRESAATSRQRKKQRVEELEALVARLDDEAKALRTQNAQLRLKISEAADAAPVPPPTMMSKLPPTAPPSENSVPLQARPALPSVNSAAGA